MAADKPLAPLTDAERLWLAGLLGAGIRAGDGKPQEVTT
jgi:hypothetical protein